MGKRGRAEFRAEAVRVALTSGLPRRQVAKDFGVGFSTLNSWVQQDRRNPEKPTAQTELEHELAELRRENRQLREEREVLKEGEDIFRHWSEDNGRTSSLRSEASEVRIHCKERRASADQTPVPDHGCQCPWIPGLAHPPDEQDAAGGHGRPGAYP